MARYARAPRVATRREHATPLPASSRHQRYQLPMLQPRHACILHHATISRH